MRAGGGTVLGAAFFKFGRLVGKAHEVADTASDALRAADDAAAETAERLDEALDGAEAAGDAARRADGFAAPQAFTIGERVRDLPIVGQRFRNKTLAKGRHELVDSGFTELPAKQTGRITFEKTIPVQGGYRKLQFHFDPHDKGGPNWHKYLTDEHGVLYQLNDRGYIDALGSNNAISRLHIPGRQ